ncbi:hypothetical protein SAMN05421823_11918 [Catalinimonas alkaloidigena]|uniref:Uncharacterized protein n=1 Tax=Catalinimonas alkaloidigena TaxID=1075417 RepID=A0A1G9V557_9BACT|nr:hypothetical protein SAMN05421823_11918 [Catalinimonas alkaloidigena]
MNPFALINRTWQRLTCSHTYRPHTLLDKQQTDILESVPAYRFRYIARCTQCGKETIKETTHPIAWY